MTDPIKCSQTSLEKKIEDFISQGKNRFYFREIVEEAKVPVNEAEDYLIPLLGENKIEGSLELHCPDCGADLGSFKKYDQIPMEITCEICGHSFPKSEDYMEIVLEVKGDFFRDRTAASCNSEKSLKV